MEAVKKIGFQISEVTNNSLLIDVNDPEKENPAILKAIEGAGGHVQFVTEIGSTLEDVYLKIVRG